MIINDELLDFWIENNLNVKMEGRSGTGKTERIKAAFNRNFGPNHWKYFSAPTMDPWVDFVGVPEKTKSPKGNDCLTLIRPQEFADDEIYALFFDELNRAKPKIIDAVMELIQFKSINGRKFNNLRMIWCATNPKIHDGNEDEVYAVEQLDPAHVDRFHIHAFTAYELNEDFFYSKFPEYAETGIAWWNALGKKNQTMQNKVSPRRLEYALDVFQRGGDMAYVLPTGCGVADLYSQLTNGNYLKRMEGLYQRNKPDEIKKALLNENFFSGIKDEVLKDKKLLKVFAPYFPSEKFNDMVQTNLEFKSFVLNDAEVLQAGLPNLLNIIEANKANPKIINEIRNKLTENNLYTQTPVNAVIDHNYREIAPDFFADELKMMWIASYIQQESNIAKLDLDYLVKALVISLAVIAKSPIEWVSSKIGLINIKKAGETFNVSFRELMKRAVADEQYQLYFKNDEIADKKIQNIITTSNLLNEKLVNQSLDFTQAVK